MCLAAMFRVYHVKRLVNFYAAARGRVNPCAAGG